MTHDDKQRLRRREFMTRAGKAGISIAAACGLAYSFYDRDGPAGQTVSNDARYTSGADYSVPAREGQTLSIVKGRNRSKSVEKAVALLGGIERFVKPTDKVVVKPNVAFESPAVLGATAHPDVVATIVRLCYKAGAGEVVVTDNPINNPSSCFRISGIGEAAEKAGAKVILPRDSFFRETTLAPGELIKNWPVFYEPFRNADKLIGIAPVKSHSRAGASMTMKNWYGLLGGRRNIFHQDINTIIKELSLLVRPSFVILDGTEVMVTNGPTGGSLSDLKKVNTMIASCDPVAADSLGSSLLGLDTSDLPYLSMAEQARAGTVDYESLKPQRAQIN